MNYQKIYDDICKRGQERILPKEIYTEKHHIVPKCLGGNNSKENLTKLTAKEHFICHVILARKLYPNNSKIWNALNKMLYSKSNGQRRYVPSGNMYECLKSEISKKFSGSGNFFYGKKHTEETKKYLSESRKGKYIGANSPNYGMVMSSEQRQLISNANKGKKRTDDVRQKMSEQRQGENNGFYGKNHTEETKTVIRQKRKLQVITTESNIKRSNSMKGEKNHFFGKSHSLETIERIKNNRPNAIKCSIDDIIYRSINEVIQAFGINRRAIKYRLDSDKEEWALWIYI